MREARNALALDTGFDLFTVNHQRCTKTALAQLGYIVDAAEVARRSTIPRCSVCQVPVRPEYDGLREVIHDTCPEHRKWRFECDNGHRWYATEAEDNANDHKCPICGEYWV